MNIQVTRSATQPDPEPGGGALWRQGLPILEGRSVVLRELQRSDAPALYAEFTTPEARRYVWDPPPNVVAFERFIDWTHGERANGKYICFGVVPRGQADAVGLFELRQLQPGFVRGELGFIFAQSAWGTGVFGESAKLLLDFVFEVVNVHRIEARAAIDNDRSNGALKKLGANQEGRLKDAFFRDSEFVDQYLWSLLKHDWLARRVA
jgi:ribosomal-protein-alanine N-acetyltransferase